MATKRNDHTYVKRRDALKKRARSLNLPCHLCKGAKGPILYDADYRDPLAFTADHVDPVATGGRMAGHLEPSHRSCNSSRGAKPLEDYLTQQETKAASKPKPTSIW